MWYIIIGVLALVLSFTFGFIVCAGLATSKCNECRLKEIKDFENDN
jgi:hypothetical protein